MQPYSACFMLYCHQYYDMCNHISKKRGTVKCNRVKNMKQDKVKYDFKAFGQAIKAARKAKGISRNQLADTLNIAPRYIASIENSGQHPSLQILYELVTLLDVSVDQFFFPEREQEKSTRRRQLDTMLDTMSETDLKIMSATAKGIEEANNDRTGE